MHYEPELILLQETLQKCKLQSTIVDLSKSGATPLLPPSSLPLADPVAMYLTSRHRQPDLHERVICRVRDPFLLHYLYLPLPGSGMDAVLIIGPFLSAVPSQQQRLELAEQQGIPPSEQSELEKLYSAVPVWDHASHLYALLEAFAEKLWGRGNFTLEDLDPEYILPHTPLSKSDTGNEVDLVRKMRTMEQRYSYENELMDAVTMGQVHKADMLLNAFSSFSFEQRLSDPIRNAKNYCIIMNTLLRKAAERGGVHPVYLDSVSSSFASKIEHLETMEAVRPFMAEAFRSYCQLVRKHSMKNYSPPVQKAIACIDTDLTGTLNLKTLSDSLNISSSYLSTIFKKETGQTLTEYITNRRIRHAKHLLSTTRLQVQTVAQHCGIMDVHYFSKVFKKITGQTPKEYREAPDQ